MINTKKLLLVVILITTQTIRTSFAQAHDMKGMDMPKNNKQQQQVTYTCPMHPEIHATKPDNCPKCGMKLIVEKVQQSPIHKHDEMKVSKDTANKKSMDMPMNDMSNMPMPKANTNYVKTFVNNTPPQTVRYDLYIRDTTVNFTGKLKRAIAVNGQIPMPTLTFTEGDTAEIVVHNELEEETSLHWHGLFLPNKEDGVPYLTQMPIKPHTTHLSFSHHSKWNTLVSQP